MEIYSLNPADCAQFRSITEDLRGESVKICQESARQGGADNEKACIWCADFGAQKTLSVLEIRLVLALVFQIAEPGLCGLEIRIRDSISQDRRTTVVTGIGT